MKNLRTIIPYVFLLCLLVMASCKDDDDDKNPDPEKTEEQKQTEKLTKTWELGDVTLEGAAIDFEGFTLTMSADADGSNKTFSTTNGLVAWPASGSWSFVDGTDYNTIKRSDGVEMNVSKLTESTLTLTFTVTEESAAGRVNGIGDYVFNLVAQ